MQDAPRRFIRSYVGEVREGEGTTSSAVRLALYQATSCVRDALTIAVISTVIGGGSP